MKKIKMDSNSNSIESFKQSFYNQDSKQFLDCIIGDIREGIYETLIEVVVFIPFLKKKEYELLKVYFTADNSKSNYLTIVA